MGRSEHTTRTEPAQSGATMRLPRTRLIPVGGRGAVGVAAWIAGAGAALSGAWLLYNALRPFDGAGAPEARTVEIAPLPAPSERDLEARQRELNTLIAAANLFDPDRRRWPEPANAAQTDAPDDDQERVITSAPDEPGAAQQASAGAPPSSSGAAGDDPTASIPITESPPAALTQRLKALTLVAIYGADGRYTAVIRDSTLPAAEGQTRHHRPGDTVGAEQWELLAVDPRRDRVILRRAGANLELRMYPETVALAPPEDPQDPKPTGASPAQETLTPDEVRRGLADAGVPEKDIAELLRLALSDEPLDADPDAGADAPLAAGEQRPAASPAPSGDADAGPTMPAELSALLRAMAQDAARRSNREQPPPEQDPEEENEEGEGSGA